ncbi:MAG: type III-A CRISPR-associated RAMP protein Csm3 [Armatimonadota bacterium]|nr:type III-A CRISPR-associated RAMP protein Csm3 [Armatimonadota bacterium]
MSAQAWQLQAKLLIRARLRCLTGLHIGGSQEGVEIGGVDNVVVKDPMTDLPYIPGSSLKGKMRSLLEWAEGKVEPGRRGSAPPHNCDREDCVVCKVFGRSAGEEAAYGPTRLAVADSFPTEETKKEWEAVLDRGINTEIKWENAIDRITSQANPRNFERVPRGSCFDVEMIFDVYRPDEEKLLDCVLLSLQLLEDSYLGGQGSRGYGRVKFEDLSVTRRPLEYYTNEGDEQLLAQGASVVELRQQPAPQAVGEETI